MKVRELTLAAMFAAIISIIAPFSIPMGMVPISMQTLIVPLIASITTTRIALLSVGGYLAIGLMGLPVFAGFHGGLASFVAPTGGYLLAMLVFPLVISPLMMRYQTTTMLVLSNGLAAVLQLALGTIWLGLAAHLSMSVALSTGFLAFLMPLVIKLILVVLLALGVKHFMHLPIG
ncbi:biotin transporter BioY [Weissella viridescens]|uniref:biotin transporter BioY n=1 Tax=Weissella viridescens TaxID=1629 RepID=UPI001D07F88A|nr:biotin transporter BioY [Weissella viridescens]MCB6840143.1 biotin transporter BioY [Weissella viridescens]MCB6846875.1 biotin transporter BioY [Weissella viridescens]WJI91046.1 biotin transporter BioY [Weissella viridescens]